MSSSQLDPGKTTTPNFIIINLIFTKIDNSIKLHRLSFKQNIKGFELNKIEVMKTNNQKPNNNDGH
jgi:hypothetical protein